ncbi:carboxypeptidase-like regulatory domain-containing protein [Pedobacter panaciterrae]
MKLTFLYNPACEMRRVKYKFLIVMKLTAILLLIGAMHLSAASYSQKISVSRRNTTLETVFQDIKQQTGYLFFYSEEVNVNRVKIHVALKNVPLSEALSAVLEQQGLTFNIINNTIVIRNQIGNKTLESIKNNFVEISGQVTDSKTRQPMPGVNVSLKSNSNIRTQTNAAGEFRIAAQPEDVLLFTYVGYQVKEVKVGEKKFLNIELEDEVTQMNDVVITRLSNHKKR